jgi:hypothetical protein
MWGFEQVAVQFIPGPNEQPVRREFLAFTNAGSCMTDDQIRRMVERFLSWKLPENFNPDGGITFKADFNEHTPWPGRHEPTGTNLLDYTQAEAMVRHMLADDPLPEIRPSAECIAEIKAMEQANAANVAALLRGGFLVD